MSFLWNFLFLATLNTIRQSYVEGPPTLDKNSFRPKPKGTVKTIEALECGDIIDCVDFYKQPTFDNPTILKDFKNKMDPNSFPTRFNKNRSHQPQLIQTWRKHGECPKGTVPIRRTLENNNTTHRKDIFTDSEYAVVLQRLNKSNGGKANFNLWKPQVEGSNEYSTSQLWISAGNAPDVNSIGAGWMVYPRLYHDKLTRLFIYWAIDEYATKGCYNTICPGFVILANDIALGAALEPISVFNRKVEVREFILSRNAEGDWYLQVGDNVLGYFPGSLLLGLKEGADVIQFGGEIKNFRPGNRHTTTEMGSGAFSGQGYKRSSFISNIKVADNNFEWVEPNFHHHVTRPACYDLTFGPPGTHLETHFYFGGPRLFRNCRD